MYSKAYADNSRALRDIPYTALVKIVDAGDMQISEFSGVVNNLAVKYEIDRNQVNINGNFEYSLQKTSAVLLIGVVGLIILFAAVVVIYSIFYLSVTGRIHQIGQLRTIGMTKKQINRMIFSEGLMLSGIGIPAGILIGIVSAYFIRPGGFTGAGLFLTVCMSAAFGVLTVLFSVSKPAKMAGNISPVEAVRYTGDEKRQRGKRQAAQETDSANYGEKCLEQQREKGRFDHSVIGHRGYLVYDRCCLYGGVGR